MSWDESTVRAKPVRRAKPHSVPCSLCGGSGGQFAPAEPLCLCRGTGRVVMKDPGVDPLKHQKAVEWEEIRPEGLDEIAWHALLELGWVKLVAHKREAV